MGADALVADPALVALAPDPVVSAPGDGPGLFHVPYPAADRCAQVADALTWYDGHELHGERPELIVSPGVVSLRVPKIDNVAEWRRNQRVANGARRGCVTSWSARSRRRMVRSIAECAFAGHGWGMVTLTYPGDWQSCAPSPEVSKAHLAAFRRRWERRYGPLEAVWKLEFQRRGAPHFHLLARIPAVALPYFRSLVARWWAEIVNSGDERHERAGTAVDVSWRGWDGAAAIARYFGKHGLWSSKEYQHDVPEAWDSSGRWWGIWNIDRVRESVSIDVATAAKARRLLRKWYRATHKKRLVVHGVEVHDGREVLRVGHRGGELRSLNGKLSGAFVLCRDGPALALALGRALGRCEGGELDGAPNSIRVREVLPVR